MDLLEPIEILLGSRRRVTFMNIDSKFINCWPSPVLNIPPTPVPRCIQVHRHYYLCS
jgi:hypothetical protein